VASDGHEEVGTLKLQSRSAIVTGGAKGIGKAIAARFAGAGANVIVADLDEVAGRDTVEEIDASGGSALFEPCDVLDLGQIEATVARCVKEFGAVDVLVNNAGGAIVAGEKLPLYETSEESIVRMLGVNLMGTVWFTRAVVGMMRDRRWGKIVNLSSVSGLQGGTPAMYSTSKGAIVSFTKSIAFEMASFGVNVNCISPWAIATREGPAELPTRIGRKGTADDVASLALFLASDEASFITGSNYVIDGGWTSGH
jgi:NAD(P)-dependent dehydrogenase (short-subunit alcohol dehydrogenase family)